MYVCNIKGKGISYTQYKYNSFILTKKTSKTYISLAFRAVDNRFEFHDHKNMEFVDLKNESESYFYKIVKRIIGNEEIGAILFNTHFVLNSKKDCLETLYTVMCHDWSENTPLYHYNKANLIFGIDYRFNSYGHASSFTANNSLKTVADKYSYRHNSETEHIEFANGYKYFCDNNKIETINDGYNLGHFGKAQKICNSLYWTRQITGLSYEKIASLFVENEFKVDELPYNNIDLRAFDKPVLEDALSRIQSKIVTKGTEIEFLLNPLRRSNYNSSITDKKEINTILEGNLYWILARTIINGESPDAVDEIIRGRDWNKVIECRKALMLLRLSDPIHYTWTNIRRDFQYPENEIYQLLFGVSHIIELNNLEKTRKIVAPLIEPVYMKCGGHILTFINEMEKEITKLEKK